MSITKWILKNGPGSIGRKAKELTSFFTEGSSSSDKLTSDRFLTHAALLKSRMVNANKAVHDDVTLVVTKSHGCLALQVFIFLLEEVETFKVLTSNEKLANDSMQVIYEVVKAHAKSDIKFSYQEFERHAFEYLLYRKCKQICTPDRYDINNLCYKIVTVDPTGAFEKVFDTYKAAADHYEMQAFFTEADEILSFYELYTDQYVFIHDCTSQEYRRKMLSNILNFKGKLHMS